MKGKNIAFLVLPAFIYGLFLFFAPYNYVGATGGDENVTICHHNEGSKGFVENTVDVASIFRNNGHLTHQDGQDIIPTIEFDAYIEQLQHRHCNWVWFTWTCGPWNEGGKHGSRLEKTFQEERTIYLCPEGSTLIPGTSRCSFSGMNDQTILANGCVVPTEQNCPTECGYTGGTVPDGDGGLKTCPATETCPLEENCPTECGYLGGTVPDGKGGLKRCQARESCSTYRWCFPDRESPTGYLAQAISISVPTPSEGKPWESGKMLDKYCSYEPAG
ncbi:MAG: hypothetical protein PHE21_03010, partial [Candidatus Dojkabacteria bacterium]|nr:hypothetical protein [Candidatus Dojkabacteria bacterium]